MSPVTIPQTTNTCGAEVVRKAYQQQHQQQQQQQQQQQRGQSSNEAVATPAMTTFGKVQNTIVHSPPLPSPFCSRSNAHANKYALQVSGPEHSPYQGATFTLEWICTQNAPAGEWRWLSEIYHPVLAKGARVCNCIIQDRRKHHTPCVSAADISFPNDAAVQQIKERILLCLATPALCIPCQHCVVNRQAMCEAHADPVFFARKARCHTPGAKPLSDAEIAKTSTGIGFSLDFGWLLRSGAYSDITIKCGKTVFHCHRTILGAQSPVLRKAMDRVSSSDPTLVVCGAGTAAIARLLHFCYSATLPKVEMSLEEALELRKAATALGVGILAKFTNCAIEVARHRQPAAVASLERAIAAMPCMIGPVPTNSTSASFHKLHPSSGPRDTKSRPRRFVFASAPLSTRVTHGPLLETPPASGKEQESDQELTSHKPSMNDNQLRDSGLMDSSSDCGNEDDSSNFGSLQHEQDSPNRARLAEQPHTGSTVSSSSSHAICSASPYLSSTLATRPTPLQGHSSQCTTNSAGLLQSASTRPTLASCSSLPCAVSPSSPTLYSRRKRSSCLSLNALTPALPRSSSDTINSAAMRAASCTSPKRSKMAFSNPASSSPSSPSSLSSSYSSCMSSRSAFPFSCSRISALAVERKEILKARNTSSKTRLRRRRSAPPSALAATTTSILQPSNS